MASYSEFWGGATYTLLNGRSPNRYHLSRILRKRGMQETGEVISTLLEDSTPASTASVTISQVQANADTSANVQGGVRTIESKEQVGLTLNSAIDDASSNTSRAVAAADVTALQTEVIPSGARATRSPTTYPVDASGNGGGGKLANE